MTGILRALLGLWFFLLGWLGAFLGMLSDACSDPCPTYERQILVGMGIVVVALVALYIATTRTERRMGSLAGKVGILAAAAVVAPLIPLVVGGILSSLAP